MKKAFNKDVAGQIRYNPRRFLAILSIVALGVAFYSGVRATSPNMRLTVDRYFDRFNASDIQLLSTMGFETQDIESIRQLKQVESVQPGYSVDGFVLKNDSTLLLSFQSLDTERLKSRPDALLNRPELLSGRYPEAPDECLADVQLNELYGFNLDETITLQSNNDSDIKDSLKLLEYKIVGFVRSVQYISLQRGNSSKGEGTLNGFVMIPEQNFKMEVFTQAYIKSKDAESSRFSDTYQKSVDRLADSIEETGSKRNPERFTKIRSEAEQKLSDGRQKLADAEEQLAEGEKELTEGEQKLKDGEKELAANRKKYNTEIANGEKKLKDAEKELIKAKTELEKNQKELEQNKERLEQAEAELENTYKQLEQGRQELAALKSQIDLMEQTNQPAEQIDQLQALYEQTKARLDDGQRQYDQGIHELAAAKAELQKGETELKKGWDKYFAGKAEYEKNLTAFNKSKSEGAKKLDEAQNELASSKRKLEDARRKFEEEKPDALEKIEKAKKELKDGEKKLADLKEPEWIALDLQSNIGFASYRQDADRIAAIGLVFPLIFFLVAALVSLTTMTRMVEDDRTVIGVLKALGYSRFDIAMRYLVYSGLAAATGIAIGILAGAAVFPRVIFDAYGILYDLPPILTPIHADSSLQAGTGAFFCAVVPSLAVCFKELTSTPASLMRPRAPKMGRRILLERLTVVWKRLNFSQKVTCRNLFRYKKRLLMTVFGIAGCTALVFTGFGLRDSITLMVPLQYDEIQKYDMAVNLRETAEKQDIDELKELLSADKSVKASIGFYQKGIELEKGKNKNDANLIVADNRDDFKKFVAFRDRRSGRPIELTDSGVVITEKVAKLLKIKAGDTVTLLVPDKPDVEVKVTALTENYVFHYIYMTQTLYNRLYGEEAAPNSVFGQLADTDKDTQSNLSKALIKLDYVSSVSFNTSLRKDFNDMVKAMDIVVVVLILSAAALAFIVLFSLTTINIDERRRELATLKVLGFYDNETALYLYRENTLITLIGIAAGLLLGVGLLSYVITTAEVDMVMFARRTHWSNYILSFLITLGFAAIVNLIMYRTISRIDMVESMKSVE